MAYPPVGDDGHFAIMKLGLVGRIGFGTPLERDGMIAWAFGKTFAEAAKRAIAEALIEQRRSAAVVKEVAGTIDSLDATRHGTFCRKSLGLVNRMREKGPAMTSCRPRECHTERIGRSVK
jgi:hypothetical protein